MMKKNRLFLMVLPVLFILGLIVLSFPQWASAANTALIIDLEGPISPGTASFLKKGIETAEESNMELAVVQLDTPGGLATSMRTMVKTIMNSSIPIVVYVAPQGAGAASAGVMVTVSAHVAAMAPSTNIGAAHPVNAGGQDIQKTMSEKVVNDMASYGRGIASEKGRNADWVERAIRESVSITAEEALEIHVIDLVAKDLDDLFRQLDGREVEIRGKKRTLSTTDIVREFYRPGLRDRVLKTISNPSIAYILMMIGMAGLFFEITHPGVIFPGVIGAICLILAFFSFQTLPVNYAGLLLIGLAIIFFIAEVMVTSYGVLSIGGIVSLTIGSIMLFEDIGVPLKLIIPTIIIISAFFLVIASLAFKAYRAKPRGGMDGLVGKIGTVQEEIDPEGLVFVHGEYWKARAGEKIVPGTKVEVIEINGLILKVRKSANQEF